MTVHDLPAVNATLNALSAVLLAIDAFFLGLVAGPASPFALSGATTPRQGAGPNALLQDNPLVAIHPPLIYTGLVLFSVPFALVVGALITGRLSGAWQLETRRWALSAGIVRPQSSMLVWPARKPACKRPSSA